MSWSKDADGVYRNEALPETLAKDAAYVFFRAGSEWAPIGWPCPPSEPENAQEDDGVPTQQFQEADLREEPFKSSGLFDPFVLENGLWMHFLEARAKDEENDVK